MEEEKSGEDRCRREARKREKKTEKWDGGKGMREDV